MGASVIADTLAGALQDFTTEIVTDRDRLLEAFRLRYQVYCRERGFEPGEGGLETDAYDETSVHVLVRHRPTGQAIGTVRLVIPTWKGPNSKLPMELVTDIPRLRALPRARIAEVSRFAMSKELRAASASLGGLARFALIRAIVQLSGAMRLTHWCALMEPKLLRLLAMSGIYFKPVGALVEHHGLRQPCYVGLAEMLERVRIEKPAVWEFITDGGKLWEEDQQPATAA